MRRKTWFQQLVEKGPPPRYRRKGVLATLDASVRRDQEEAHHTKKEVEALHDGMMEMLKEMQRDKIQIASLRERVAELEAGLREAWMTHST